EAHLGEIAAAAEPPLGPAAAADVVDGEFDDPGRLSVLVHEGIDLHVHAELGAGAYGAEEAMPAAVPLARCRLLERARLLCPYMPGAFERGRVLEGVQIEIDRAGPHDRHLGEIAHILANDRLAIDCRLVIEAEGDGLPVARKAVENELRAAEPIQ